MSARATPETDAISQKQLIRISRSSNDPADLLRDALEEMEAHARSLERQRDEAREERDAAKLFIAACELLARETLDATK